MDINEVIEIEFKLLKEKILRAYYELDSKYKDFGGFKLGQIVCNGDDYGIFRWGKDDGRCYIDNIGICNIEELRKITNEEYLLLKDRDDFQGVSYQIYITDSIIDYGKDNDSDRRYTVKTIKAFM